jgi:hypothetical protein
MDFDPSTMTFDEQETRTPSLDALWKRYTQTLPAYTEALRIELWASGNTDRRQRGM